MKNFGVLETEVIRIGIKIDESKNIQETEKLFSKMMNVVDNLERNELTEKILRKSTDNIIFSIGRLRRFYDEWGENQTPPSDKEELNSAERLAKQLLEKVGKLTDEECPSFFNANYRSETKKGLIALRVMIYEEKNFLKANKNTSQS